jgi:hypothetical protein
MQFSSLPGPFVGCHSLFYGVQPAARNLLRFAESGYESGYIFELCFIFVNNPSILGFFEFQCAS